MRDRSRAVFWFLLAVLGFLGWWGGDRVRREAWTTNDEPVHLAASRELRSGPGVVSNFEHPVLMKVVAAAGLGPVPAPHAIDETRAARTLFPVLFGLLVALSGAWVWTRSGPIAGLAVAGILAAEPTMRAHAALVQSDFLVALFFVAAGFLLDLSDGSTRAGQGFLLASGVAYGLAMASKYSALPFLPVFAVIAFLRIRRPRRSAGRPGRGKKHAGPLLERLAARRAVFLVALLVVGPAVVTAASVQQAVLVSTTPESLARGISTQLAGLDQLRPALWMASHLPKGLAAYGTGLLWVQASSVPGFRPNYFFGVVSGKGWLAYFTVALGIKLTTAAAVFVFGSGLAALIVLVARKAAGGRRGLRAGRLAQGVAVRAFVPGSLALCYLGAASLSDVNIGVRHVLPVIPLGLVAAAGVVATVMSGRRRALAALLAAVVLASASEAFATRGREIPFGNLFVGGPSGTRRVLSDSNADWGEAQGRLFDRARVGDLGRTAVVALAFDAELGEPLDLHLSDSIDAPPVNTAVVSVFLVDLAHALKENSESYSKIDWMKGWLIPLVDEIERRAVSQERLGDEYVIYGLGPAPGGRRPGGVPFR